MSVYRRNYPIRQNTNCCEAVPYSPQSSKINMKISSIIRETGLNGSPHATITSHPIVKDKAVSLLITKPTSGGKPLSDNSRANRLYTLPDQPKQRKYEISALINQTQFLKHSTLVQFYSSHVFSQTFKFKRFTGILKKKFKHSLQNSQHSQQTQKKQKEWKLWRDSSPFQPFQQRYSKSMDREFFETLDPKLTLKQRPSSGIPMKKGEMLIKRRKNSFNECSKSCSIDIRHIDALKCSQSNQSPRIKIKTLVTPHCFCLKSAVRAPLQVRGGRCESIEPWEAEVEKVRLLTDLDITVKI